MTGRTMGRLLSRQLIAEWLGVTLLALVLLLAALFVFQAVRVAPLVFRAGLHIPELARLALLLLPALLALVVPLALALGLLSTFARWQRDGEWTALSALGVSKRRLLPPVFLVCLAGFGLQLALGHWIAPRSLQAAETWLEQTGVQALLHMVRPGQFTALGGENLLYVQDVTGDGAWVAPFWILDEEGRQELIWAREARFDLAQRPTRLSLLDGGWRRDGQNEASRALFARMEIPLSSMFQVVRDSEPLAVAWQKADAATLQMLYRGCTQADFCARLAGEFSRRNASSAALLLVGALGLVLLGGRLLSRPAAAYALMAGLLLAYHLLERLGMNLGEKGVWSPFLGAWLPVFVGAALLGLFSLRRVE